MSEIKVTREIRQAVAEEDCKMTGHTYAHIQTFGVDGPVAVVCTRCGKRWKVEHES